MLGRREGKRPFHDWYIINRNVLIKMPSTFSEVKSLITGLTPAALWW